MIYIVRGEKADAPVSSPHCDLSAAIRLAAALEARGATVRIYAVGEDGAETPLPTYEEALAIVDLARRLIRSSDLKVTTGPPANRARIDCDDDPREALFSLFYAEEEAERTIPGLVCAECDRPICKGQTYGGKGGHAAHKACRNWPAGTAFKTAGQP